ncbi:MAG: transcription elongation GreA/GreB family factor [Oleispira sp.]|jgi:transcription elongation GreA/GreB family factor
MNNLTVDKSSVNKKELLQPLLSHLQQEIDATLSAVNEAHALASHEQSKPENQYDTLALEAAYLAHGQSARIAELQRQFMLLDHLELSDCNDNSRIAVGALVHIKETDSDDYNKKQWLWLLPVAGGILLKFENNNESKYNNDGKNIAIRTITPEAPLAKALVGSYVGDEVVLNLGHKKKQFEIIELL